MVGRCRAWLSNLAPCLPVLKILPLLRSQKTGKGAAISSNVSNNKVSAKLSIPAHAKVRHLPCALQDALTDPHAPLYQARLMLWVLVPKLYMG